MELSGKCYEEDGVCGSLGKTNYDVCAHSQLFGDCKWDSGGSYFPFSGNSTRGSLITLFILDLCGGS
jgi:hypothetical protein